MPTAENSFYLDGEATGRAYETMVAVELVDYVRKTFSLASSPEDTYIAGLSMGGFGALHTGLAHPDRFGKIGCMSSALIVHEIAHAQPGFDNGIGNYAYYRSCFGDLETVEERDVNPEILALRLKETASAFPELFMCCGTEDFLIEPNRDFHRFLVENKIPHQYFESPGGHDGIFWSEYIVKIVNWMFA
jgi:enterochelin esterase-like enzyme